MPTPQPADPLIGTTVSQYEIVAKLGGGGMGVVYKARDIKLGRSVALKFLPPQWSHDESAKQRFVREAQAASATNHRNICVIHNIEETPDGRLFIVMAYYEGETLKQRLERGPLPIIEAVEIASEIADGLAKAHAQGVVHRDVKPGNLILTEDGVKILDFGLAKFADALQLTVPGSTIGTVAYMSPEQARGEEADVRSDVWALGIVMFEMLTGSVPFRGTYPEATFHAIKNEPLPSLRAARPDVPEALERIVLKALEKDPAKRFQTAREPARDLKLLAGRTVPLELRTEEVERPAGVTGGSPGSGSSGRRTLVRTRLVVAAAALIGLAAGLSVWMTRPIARVRVAIVPVSNHTGNPELDRYRLALTSSLVEEIAHSPNIQVVPFVRVVEMIRPYMSATGDISSNDAIRAIALQSGAPFLVVPTLVYRDGAAAWLLQVQIRNAQTGTTAASYETAPITSSLLQQTAFRLVVAGAEAIQRHFKQNGPGRSFEMRSAGYRFREPDAARAFAEGMIGYDELEYAAALAGLTESAKLDPQHALTHAWLSRVNLLLSRKNEAVAAAQRAKALITNDIPKSDGTFVEAVLAESLGDLARAEEAYRRLVEVEPDDGWARAELADFLKRRQDRNQQAIDAYHDLLRLDGAYIRPHVDLCQLYTRIDDHALAEQEGQIALGKYQALGVKAGQAQALLCLGETEREQGGAHLADARRNIAAAAAIIGAIGEPYNLARATFYSGLVEYSDRKLGDAASIFDRAAAQLDAVGNRVLQGVALMNLGVVNYDLGRPTPAAAFYRQAREVLLQIGDERRVAEIDVDVAGLQVDYGGNPAETLKQLTNAKANLERLGHVDFQLVAMRNEAEIDRNAGRLDRARTVLRSALEIAREKQLTSKIADLQLALARTDIQSGDYERARQALEDLVGADQDNLEARIALGRVLVKLGDYQSAKGILEAARLDAESRQQLGLLPSIHLAAGEYARGTGDSAARSDFESAVLSWSDPLPNPFSVEARCDLGFEKAQRHERDAARELESGIAEARRAYRPSVEALCRTLRARFDILAKRDDDAVAILEDIPEDTPETTLGAELRGQVEYWRGVALSSTDEVRATGLTEKARREIEALRAGLSPRFRASFAARPEIAPILSPSAVRSHQ